MAPEEATSVRPQPFEQWQLAVAGAAEAVRLRGLGERPGSDEPAADAVGAGDAAPAADAGPVAAADADVAPEPEPLSEPDPKPKPAPRTAKRGTRRRTPKE